MNEPGDGISTRWNTNTAHGIFFLQHRIVSVCKYRRQILNPDVCGFIRKILKYVESQGRQDLAQLRL
jgi:hypothetical protein